MIFAGPDDSDWSLAQWLGASSTDALLVAQRGNLVATVVVRDRVNAPIIVRSPTQVVTLVVVWTPKSPCRIRNRTSMTANCFIVAAELSMHPGKPYLRTGRSPRIARSKAATAAFR